jgi:LAO/AO transport system kinase
LARAAHTPDDKWIERLLNGERSVLARSITWIENQNADGATVLAAIQQSVGRAVVVGFTGPPGAGKSTLVSAYVRELRRQGRTIGVVAVDPSSPFSGGAILGDRIRMGEHTNDPGVFVRSVASRGHMGGLSLTAARIVDVMDASGFDVIVVETVGAGQSEYEVAEVADTKVVISTPGYGDDIQAVKAGILEIADILVVNKADMDKADQTVTQLKAMLQLTTGNEWATPVLKTVATTGDGVPELAASIDEHGAAMHGAHKAGPVARTRRLIASMASDRVRKHLAQSSDEQLNQICEAVARGELDFDTAVNRAIKIAGEEN